MRFRKQLARILKFQQSFCGRGKVNIEILLFHVQKNETRKLGPQKIRVQRKISKDYFHF